MSRQQPTKKERREVARGARLEAERKRRKAKKFRQIGLAALVGFLVIALVVYFVTKKETGPIGDVSALEKASGCTGVKTVDVDPSLAEQQAKTGGNAHLRPGDPAPKYVTNPPTSGAHADQPAPWGPSDERIDDRILVHNLEHGGVVVHYKDLTDTEVKELSDYVDGAEDGLIAVPDPNIPTTIGLAGWTKLETCDKYNLKIVRHFAQVACNKGTEAFSLKCA